MSDVYNYSALVNPTDEVLQQEVVTYLKRDDKIMKHVVSRVFFDKDDYIDTMTSEVLYTVK